MELSRGCPSTGWCFCLGGAHVLQLAAFFSERAQADVIGPEAALRRRVGDMPSGVVERVADGWRVTGTWNYCSGAPWSTHFIARARIGHEPDAQLALVAIPRDGWRMLDDWHGILGMRGTGSHSIEVPGMVVPDHFVVADDPFDAARTTAPSSRSPTATRSTTRSTSTSSTGRSARS